MNVKITGIGAAIPDNKVTNDDISELVDTNSEWIVTRTGIKNRFHAQSGVYTSELAVAAGKAAIDGMVNNTPIDALILATSTPDRLCPASGPKVAYKLGLGNISAFDINAVCTGFIYGLELADALLRSGKFRKIILIGADVFTSILDPKDRTTFPLFGDAAGALILETGDGENNLLATLTGSDGRYEDLITIKNEGSESKMTLQDKENTSDNYFRMEGKEVFLKAVSHMKESIKEILTLSGITEKEIDILVPHQANLRIINTLADIFDLNHEKVLISLDEFGNTSAASIPLTLAKGIIDRKISGGDSIVITAFGGGITWGAGVIKWPSEKINSKIVLV